MNKASAAPPLPGRQFREAECREGEFGVLTQEGQPRGEPSVSAPILALFTLARRRHMGLAPRDLEMRLNLPKGSVRACENQRILKPDVRARLMEFNKLEDGPSRHSASQNCLPGERLSCGKDDRDA